MGGSVKHNMDFTLKNLAWNNVLECGVIFKLYNFGIPLQQSTIYPIGQLR